ncbi:hypothetical protein [Dysgonomonas sp. GY617]|uniref:hypothetical protein n=1 Tax=Dysgonomonas sp. GY617 TaxID=2780420 RepID=UPI001883F41D|nr:hypothetical protein [Dysgonomonas sp. GY617]MBF0577701.1 hypothetical protein [Dysgonomonas sp. GY617]
MSEINIKGDRNIFNTGTIQGDYIIDNTIIHRYEITISDLLKTFTMSNEDKEQSLVNMTDAQKKLAEAIDKFSQAELVRAESGKIRDETDKLRAEADKNNSIANLNYSKIMLEDREIIKIMLDKLN